MLLISTLLLLISGGVSGVVALLWTLQRARQAPVDPSPELPCQALLLVPGKRLQRDRPDRDYEERLRRALACWQRQPISILLLGGLTGGTVSEAQVGANWLIRYGVDAKDLLLEQHSRHTLENLEHARSWTEGRQPLILVSNRYHLPRLELMAQGMGLEVELLAAEPCMQLGLKHWPRWLLESFYNHWYWVGSRWARLTGDRDSLRRLGQ